ncbi:hypothetical protein [Jatrophihabitans endophyticus]|uniref:hypothetical protein n=1 Tax=Jatrophihabitans endophyticus TaxID=1206085 RepID=UPI0019FE4E9A|nr:hypothetical protein [Jatrophihabitans endophyticus]MBE7190307.1 hypothetical protein [Jatrophihabitans endophyticus]
MGLSSASFIEPDRRFAGAADPLGLIGRTAVNGYRAVDHLPAFRTRNPLIDDLLGRERDASLRYEDQCSPRYYLDVADAVVARRGDIRRIVEVGVFLGGASEVFASGTRILDYELDLVDVDADYLGFTHERLRRVCPEAVDRVRLFHGSLPEYVRTVLLPEATSGVFVHHDASHRFEQVVKDLSALSFVREQVLTLAIQDTNLRGRIGYCNFVDAAVWAVFGRDVACEPIGAVFDETQVEMVNPNRFEGNYFMPGVAEGMLIDFDENSFLYPHPTMTIDEFL